MILKRISTILPAIATAAVLMFAAAGCDDPLPKAPPSTAPAAPTKQTVQPRPTTQQLTDSQWVAVPISLLPMSIKVPPSWEHVEVTGSRLFMMEGYTPNGAVSIALADRGPLGLDKFNDFVKAAKKRMDEKGPAAMRFETRNFPDFDVLERQYSEPKSMMLIKDKKGQLVEQEGRPMKWSYLIFLKKEASFQLYELEINDLSVELYEQDKEFLQRIFSGLTNETGRKN